MILADFKIRVAPRSKFRARVRIFSSCREMERTASREKKERGEFQAAMAGVVRKDVKPDMLIGDMFFYTSKYLVLDIIHECVHMATHYTRDIRNMKLDTRTTHRYDAIPGEENLCVSTEHMAGQIFYVAKRTIPALITP